MPAAGAAPADRVAPPALVRETRADAARGNAPRGAINSLVGEGVGVGVPPGAFRKLVFGEIILFVAILTAAYAYAWRKGVFAWR